MLSHARAGELRSRNVGSDAVDLETWEGRSLLLRVKEWTARLWWRLL